MSKRNNMKNNNVVTEDNYREKVLKTMIILCWIILGVCFAVKLFGGNFFEIVCNNQRFIKVCRYIDENNYLLFGLQFILYSIATSLYLITCCKRELKTKDYFIIIMFSMLCYITKNIIYMNINTYLSVLVETIMLIVFPLFYETSIWSSIIFCVVINCFSFISVIVKTIGHSILPNFSLIALIMLIDYYIMIILLFLYSIQLKRRNNMGLWGIGWLHKEITKYETIKSKNLKRIEELQDENKEIDKKIAELKSKEEK